MPNRLTEIEQRLAQATPGPWEKRIAGIEGDNYIAGTGPWYRERGNLKDDRAERDADLIAHATTDLAYLLARLAKAEQMAEALKVADRIYWELIGGGRAVEIAERADELHEACTKALTAWQEAQDAA